MMQGARVEFDGVGKLFGPVTALQPTSFEVAPGEFFALLGPSGSGKSTLLGTLAGFLAPSYGRVLINGHDLTAVPPHRRNIGMVFQNYALFPYLTVAQNIAFPLKMRRVRRGEMAARVGRALDMVRLAGFESRMPAQLSGGQQQRVALARAAVYDPPLLLMDEPLGALDKNLREEMQEELRQFHRKVGATILYVTHDQSEAATMADRLAIINNGKVEQIGPPHGVYEKPGNSFVARFLGEANILPLVDGEAAAGENRMVYRSAQGLKLVSVASGRGRVGCIRPENIAIGTGPLAHDNCFRGRIEDILRVASSIRYRVAITDGCSISVRVPSDKRAPILEVQDEVHIAWDAEEMLILPD